MTLLRIRWRITSRQSFAINKAIVRNNNIVRRIKEGNDEGTSLATTSRRPMMIVTTIICLEVDSLTH